MSNIASRISEYYYWTSQLNQLVKFIENDEKIIIERFNTNKSQENDSIIQNIITPVSTSI